MSAPFRGEPEPEGTSCSLGTIDALLGTTCAFTCARGDSVKVVAWGPAGSGRVTGMCPGATGTCGNSGLLWSCSGTSPTVSTGGAGTCLVSGTIDNALCKGE